MHMERDPHTHAHTHTHANAHTHACTYTQLTTLMWLRNVLRRITEWAVERRDARSLDPDGAKEVFNGCYLDGQTDHSER